MGEGGGKEAWIYVALDPRTLKVVYLEPFFVRDEGNTNAFLEHLVETYGQWPKLVITDGGWLWAAFSFWQVEGKITWRVVRGGERSVIEGFFGEFLKRRIKDFDRYFPHKERLGQLEKVALDLRLAPQPHHGRMFLTGPTSWMRRYRRASPG